MALLGLFVMNPPMSACRWPYFNLQFTEEETETQGAKVTAVSTAGTPGDLSSGFSTQSPTSQELLGPWQTGMVSHLGFTHRRGMHLPPVRLLLTPAPVALQQTAEPLELPCLTELQVLGATTSLPGALSQLLTGVGIGQPG